MAIEKNVYPNFRLKDDVICSYRGIAAHSLL